MNAQIKSKELKKYYKVQIIRILIKVLCLKKPVSSCPLCMKVSGGSLFRLGVRLAGVGDWEGAVGWLQAGKECSASAADGATVALQTSTDIKMALQCQYRRPMTIVIPVQSWTDIIQWYWVWGRGM